MYELAMSRFKPIKRRDQEQMGATHLSLLKIGELFPADKKSVLMSYSKYPK